METPPITFDQLPLVVSGLSEKLDRVLDILEKVGISDLASSVTGRLESVPDGHNVKSQNSVK